MKKYKNSKAIIITILALALFVCLSLIGILGGLGSAVSHFLVGFFGLSIYAFAFSTVAICIVLLCGGQVFIKGKSLAKYILLLSVLILTLHTATSKDFFDNGFFAYLMECYESNSTAGGMLFGIFAYLPAQLITYVGALIVFCLLFLGCALLALTKNKVRSGNYRSKKVVYGNSGTLTEFKTSKGTTEESVGDSLYIATIGSKKDSKVIRSREGHDTYIHYEPIDSIFGQGLQGEGLLSDVPEEEEVIAPVLEADAKQTAYDKLFNFQKTYSPSTIEDDSTAIVDKGSAAERLFSSTYTPKTDTFESTERTVSYYPDKKEETPKIVEEQAQADAEAEERKAFFTFAFDSDPRTFTNGYFNSGKEATDTQQDEVVEEPQIKSSYSGVELDFTPSSSFEYDGRLSSVLDSLTTEPEEVSAPIEPITDEEPDDYVEDSLQEEVTRDVEDTFASLFTPKTEVKQEKFDDDFFTEEKEVEEESQTAYDTLFGQTQASESISEFFGDEEVSADGLFSSIVDEDEKVVEEVVQEEFVQPTEEEKEEIEAVPEVKPVVQKRDFSALENGNFNQKAKKAESKSKVLPGQMSLTEEAVEPKRRPYIAPPLDLLARDQEGADLQGEDHEINKKNLEEIMANFKVDGHVSGIVVGPTFTRYEINLSPGVSVKKILGITDDIAMGLGGKKIRIEAPVPGKTCVGIEIPNAKRKAVGLRGVLEKSNFFTAKSPLTVCLGRNISGENITCDLADMPHLLVAGTTGAGKSVSLNAMLCSLLYKSSPEDLRLILVDPKRVELNRYNGLPHMLIKEAITDAPKVIRAMDWLISEMDNRYELFSKCGVNNISGYNSKVLQSGQGKKLPYILMVIDEIGDLMLLVKNDIEDRIQRLAQLARAAGIHLIVATQRPDVNVITGTIKANLPSRIAFAVTTTGDSMTILGVGGAEKLLGKGDMLFSSRTAPEPSRIQCAFLQDEEADAVTSFVRNKNDAFFDENIEKAIMTAPQENNVVGPDGQDEVDPCFWDAVEFAISQGSISVTAIQRKFRLGFSRAGRIIDQMYERNFIAKSEGAKAREVLITMEQYKELISGGDSTDDE